MQGLTVAAISNDALDQEIYYSIPVEKIRVKCLVGA